MPGEINVNAEKGKKGESGMPGQCGLPGLRGEKPENFILHKCVLIFSPRGFNAL